MHKDDREDLVQLKGRIAACSPDSGFEQVRDYAFGMDLCAEVDPLVADERDVLGLAIAGGLSRYRAWRVRGGRVAEFTSEQRFKRYEAELQQAWEFLDRALDEDPLNPLAAGFYASSCLDADHERKVFAEGALARSRGPAAAHLELMTAHSWKWGGSQEEMWDYVARNSRLDGPVAWGLTARGHFEQKSYYELAPDKGTLAATYFRRPQVRRDLAEASDAALAANGDAAALRTVDAWLAIGLMEAEDRARARAHLVRLGRYRDPTIWHYGWALISPRLRFHVTRLRAGLGI